jgi:uncharacterized protein YbaP (TraB family)
LKFKHFIILKKSFVLFLLLLSISFYGQTQKSLLWEISGNGIEKKSYLYGSMHVTDKVSYHLSDSFFTHLLGADMVANESDPETWGELNDLINQSQANTPFMFYSKFYLTPLPKEELLSLFYSNYNYFQNLLSGVDGYNADYSEDTVLDTFIFQTGKKYNKKTVGLEKIMESIIPLLKIDDESARPEPENILIIQKIIKDKNPFDLLKDFYREKDIVMLDSINKLMMSEKAHDAMIVHRNKIMTHSIDSLVKQGSLFAAVGAAHLAGNEGIIKMLIDKGYTLTPVFDEFTETGKNKQKDIETYFPNPQFKMGSTADGMVQMPLNKFIEEDAEHLGSPDYINGGVINIKRLPLNYFLKKETTTFNPATLDSLFFENIPGDIIEKKFFETNSYKGYDIKNKRKSGNSQRYKFYITPLEIISISMTGVGEYVRKYEADVFDPIQIKEFSENWETFTPQHKGFSIEVPVYHFAKGDFVNKINDIELQGYLNANQSYFFLQEKTLNDLDALENTAFENKQIHYEFLLQHKADTLQTHFNTDPKYFTSQSEVNGKKVQLKSVIQGNKYYLMGSVNATEELTNRFFSSFQTQPFVYQMDLAVLQDTLANFSVEIPKKINQSLFFNVDRTTVDTKNIHLPKSKYYSFLSASGQTVEMEYYKLGKYDQYMNLDSVKVAFKKDFINDYNYDGYLGDYDYDYDYYEDEYGYDNFFAEKKGLKPSAWDDLMNEKEVKWELLNEKVTYDEVRDEHIFEATAGSPDADQAIQYKAIFKGDSYYILSSLVPKNYQKNDPFIEKVFNTFKPTLDSYKNPFESRFSSFLEDAMSDKDTIRFSALNSVHQLNLTKDDFEQVQNFIDTFEFKDSDIEAKETLINAIGGMEDKRVIPYLENLYKKEDTESSVQLEILGALTLQKSKAAYEKILELMEYDLPIPDEPYEISMLFNRFSLDLENAKYLFPPIFDYYQTEEYKSPILSLCQSELDEGKIQSKKLEPQRKNLMTQAKLELKRLVSWKEKDDAKDEDEENDYYYADDAPVGDLMTYLNILYYFSQDDAFKDLVKKSRALTIPELTLEINRLDLINKTSDQAVIAQSLSDPETRFMTALLLLNQDEKAQLNLSDDEISVSALYHINNLEEKDSINLLKKEVVLRNQKEVTFYFYQVIRKVKEDEAEEKELLTMAFVSKDSKINPLAYVSLEDKSILDEEELPEMYQEIIDETFGDDSNRANYSIIKSGGFNPYGLMGY